jgi:hypothetical protein
MNLENQYIVVNGQKIPLNVYMQNMNRHQRRAFLADLKKSPKTKTNKLSRADNVPEIPESETKESISNLEEKEEVKVENVSE